MQQYNHQTAGMTLKHSVVKTLFVAAICLKLPRNNINVTQIAIVYILLFVLGGLIGSDSSLAI